MIYALHYARWVPPRMAGSETIYFIHILIYIYDERSFQNSSCVEVIFFGRSAIDTGTTSSTTTSSTMMLYRYPLVISSMISLFSSTGRQQQQQHQQHQLSVVSMDQLARLAGLRSLEFPESLTSVLPIQKEATSECGTIGSCRRGRQSFENMEEEMGRLDVLE